MKRVLGIILLCGCLAMPVRAQDTASSETLRAAQELSAIMTGGTIQQMTSALIGQMWPGIESHLAGKVDAATLSEMRSEIEPLFSKFVNESLKDAPAIYARHFSAAELHELVAFYKSPTGAKTLRELPKITAESYDLIAPRMAPFQQEIAASMQAVMKKHGYKD